MGVISAGSSGGEVGEEWMGKRRGEGDDIPGVNMRGGMGSGAATGANAVVPWRVRGEGVR